MDSKSKDKALYEGLKKDWINAHQAYKGCRCSIVSLGWNCFSRSIPTEWGIKKYKAEGELSCPYDLAMIPIKTTLKLIRNGWKDEIFSDFRRDKEGWWFCDKYGMIFNHDTEIDSLEELKKRYQQREVNFKKYSSNKYGTIYIHTTYDNIDYKDIDDFYQLVELLQCNKKSNKILIINDLSPSGLDVSLGGGFIEFLRNNKESILYCRSLLPHPNYVWWQPDDRFTRAGYLYEVNLMETLCQAIDRLEKRVWLVRLKDSIVSWFK
jgi:hypothetical protein